MNRRKNLADAVHGAAHPPAFVPECTGAAASRAGVSASRRSPHFAAEACGSRSTSTVDKPARSPETARPAARVVFPVRLSGKPVQRLAF